MSRAIHRRRAGPAGEPMKRGPVGTLVVVATLLGLAGPFPAQASGRRPVFDPEDLEMEEPGVLDLELNTGLVRDGQTWRVIAPDLSIDLGLTDELELDLDATASWVSPDNTALRPQDVALDSLWLSLKHALYFDRDENGITWALGLQHGLRLPLQGGQQGVGYEALLLGGLAWRGFSMVLNLGGFVDPIPYGSSLPPRGLLGGLSWHLQLDDGNHFAFVGDLSAAWYADTPAEFAATPGFLWAPIETLEITVSALGGWLSGGAAGGVLIGISPKFRVWGQP